MLPQFFPFTMLYTKILAGFFSGLTIPNTQLEVFVKPHFQAILICLAPLNVYNLSIQCIFLCSQVLASQDLENV